MDSPKFFWTVLCALIAVELRAESVPETNALVAEVRIEPAVAVTNGYFGRIVAAGAGVFVVGFETWADAEGGAPLAAVYERAGSGVTEGKVLRAPDVSEATVQELATDGQRVAAAVREGEAPGIYLFARQDSGWLFETKLLAGSEVRSMALDGNVLVTGVETGVLVHEWTEGEWLERLLERPASAKGAFGNAVDVDETGTIIVGSKGDIRSDAGQAYIYRRGETGWEMEAEFLSGPGTYEPFAHSVAIDSDLAAISSYPSRFDDGYVSVFERVEGSWVQRPGVGRGEPGDFFGEAIALDGRNLVVGAASARKGGGAAYLFRWSGKDFGRLQLYVPGVHLLGYSVVEEGYNVAVAGNSVLAGAPYFHNWTGPTRSGAAFVFEFDFDPLLVSPRLNSSRTSLEFHLNDVEPGEVYVIERKERLQGEWEVVKEVTVSGTEAEAEGEIPAGSGQGFFRARLKTEQPGG